MADVSDFYRGILKPGGGIYTPGPPVVMPSSIGSTPSGVSRVTPEGLNVRGVNTVAIDPNGQPILSAPAKAAAITKALLATSGIPHASGTMMTGKDESRLSPSGGILSAYGEIPRAPAQDAITAALMASKGPGAAWGGGWGSDGLGRFLSGDPGMTDWSVADNGNGGLYDRPATGFATQPQLAPIHPVDALHASLLASQPVATGTAQDGRYSYVKTGDGAITKTINPMPVAQAAERAQLIQNTNHTLRLDGSARSV